MLQTLASLTWTNVSRRHRHLMDKHNSSRSWFVKVIKINLDRKTRLSKSTSVGRGEDIGWWTI